MHCRASGCGQFGKRDTEGVGHPFAVSRVGLQAVANVAELDLPRRTADGPDGVSEEELLFLVSHQAEEGTGLGVVIVVLAVIPVVCGAFNIKGWLGKFRLLLPLILTVGLVAEGAAMIAVNPHGTVAMVAVERAAGGVDRDQVVVYS